MATRQEIDQIWGVGDGPTQENQSTAAEKSVLGCLMYLTYPVYDSKTEILGKVDFNNVAEKFKKVKEIISFSDFSVESHANIFLAIQTLVEKFQYLPEPSLVAESVEAMGKPFDSEYIRNLAEHTATAQNLLVYAKVVKDKSLARQASGEDELGWPKPKDIIEKGAKCGEVTADMLPANVGNWVADVADRIQIHPTFSSATLISIVSAIIARRVAIRPKKNDDWMVICNLWALIVAPPGMQKSPALDPMLEPVLKREMELIQYYKDELTEFENSDQQGDKPVRRTLYTNDATAEALHSILVDNPQGGFFVRDEMSGLLDGFMKPGREGDRKLLLEGWNGNGSYSVSRIGRGFLFAKNMCLTLCGGIQPSVFAKHVVNAQKGVSDDGLLERFQILVESKPKKDFVFTDREPNWNAKKRFDKTMDRLLDLPMHGEPVVTRFDGKTQKIFNAWFTKLEKRLRSGKLPRIMESHLSKYRSLLPSLALIFEVISNEEFNVGNIQKGEHLPKVSLPNLELAIRWTEFLEQHAQALFLDGDTAANPAALLAEKILMKVANKNDWHVYDVSNARLSHAGVSSNVIDNTEKNHVCHVCHVKRSMRDIKRLSRAKVESKYFDEAMQILEEFGWIKLIQTQSVSGSPPSIVVEFHPDLLEKYGNGVTNVTNATQTVLNSEESSDKSTTNSTTPFENINVPNATQNVPDDIQKVVLNTDEQKEPVKNPKTRPNAPKNGPNALPNPPPNPPNPPNLPENVISDEPPTDGYDGIYYEDDEDNDVVDIPTPPAAPILSLVPVPKEVVENDNDVIVLEPPPPTEKISPTKLANLKKEYDRLSEHFSEGDRRFCQMDTIRRNFPKSLMTFIDHGWIKNYQGNFFELKDFDEFFKL